MNNEEFSKLVAQGAAVWDQRTKHAEIMKRLEEITYSSETIYCDESYGSEYDGMSFVDYTAHLLPEQELVNIVKRGNDEEIMFLISRYNRIFDNPPTSSSGYLDPEVQKLLVKRNRKEEIDAITSRYGFCEQAQDEMFACWTHDQLVAYSDKHGFVEKWQLFILDNWSEDEIADYVKRHELSKNAQIQLIKQGKHPAAIMAHISWHDLEKNAFLELVNRGDHEEIMEAIQTQKNRDTLSKISLALVERGNHEEIIALLQRVWSLPLQRVWALPPEAQKAIWQRGNEVEKAVMARRIELCDEILDEIIGNVEAGQPDPYFALHVQRIGRLPESYQKRLILGADKHNFAVYIRHQPFNAKMHALMLQKRDRQEVLAYMEHYHSLSDEALAILAKPENLRIYSDDKVEYFNLLYSRQERKLFLEELLEQDPLDVHSITEILLLLQQSRYIDKKQKDLMKHGSEQEKRAYFATGKILCQEAFTDLFFGGDFPLLVEYLNSRKGLKKIHD